MTCKECIHYDVCEYFDREESIPLANTERCIHFKPKSRFIELPCEVGQKVYVDDDAWCRDAIFYDHCYICSKLFAIGEVVSFSRTKKQLLMKIRVSNNIHTRYKHERFTVNALGKTVFLTKEEAEKALEERNKK